MNQKEMAMRQIDEIYAIVQNNLKAVISGPLMIAVGLGIMAIPFIEYLFNLTIDPLFANVPPSFSPMLIFALRTIFYWLLFGSIVRFFKVEQKTNVIINKVFSIGKIFPFIALSVAATLALTGYAALIAPIVLILIGCLFAVYGQFSLRIVSLVAGSLICAGIAGIWLSKLSIPHLWAYLVIYEGLAFVIMGLVISRAQRQTISK